MSTPPGSSWPAPPTGGADESRAGQAVRVLVFAIGNVARGDDGLGVRLAERIRERFPEVAVLEVYQLQPEHALDLADASLVLFCDAALGLSCDCELREVEPELSRVVFSHSMSAQAMLGVYRRIEGGAPPPSFTLALRASDTALGEGLSVEGERALERGWALTRQLLAAPDADAWRSVAGQAFSRA